jgi:hypothetical protein
MGAHRNGFRKKAAIYSEKLSAVCRPPLRLLYLLNRASANSAISLAAGILNASATIP